MVLLLHGTGASSHSWVPLAARLEHDFTLVAPDLPGQGFTQGGDVQHASLPGMTRSVAALLRELSLTPEMVVGHSAGAALACSLCLMGALNPKAVVSINGALLPFGRAAAPVFNRAARFLASGSVFPQLVALHALPRKPIERMVRQTGSSIPPEMLRCYRELLGMPSHIAGTLRMMANWELQQLERNLERLEPALHLFYGDNDQVLPPEQALLMGRRLPQARLLAFEGLGHLAHEEAPAKFAKALRALARKFDRAND